ncbi:MAG: D-alanyl-D-alanine carboxypeptidase [Clostridia bacterium]|nr:D-alanyl-D-alanine carboxypeptidase [Clostridia bacterium]
MERRRAIIAARQEAQRRARRIRLIAACILGVVLLILLAVCIRACTRDDTAPTGNTEPETSETAPSVTDPPETEPEAPPITAPRKPTVSRPQMTAATEALSGEIGSTYAVLISLKDHTVIAARSANTRMHPASMTKVMSLIVAYEHIEDLSAPFTVTSTIIDPVYTAGASLAGFSPNETVTILDLLYGMILPSGAEASVALAEHVAGSEDAFADLMNEKAAEMGLTDTHFENCTGLTGTNHYSTAVEMAMILDYAMQYEECAKILSTYQYTTTPTEKHPEGILLESTMFSRMYGDEPDGVTIIAGKTGYTDRARHCLMSYATDDTTGEAYIFVSADNSEKFGPVFDAIEVYSAYAKSDDVPVIADPYLP